jgi:hypothetical protein
VAIGDFNEDGRPDLAVANRGGTLSVLLNIGTDYPTPVVLSLVDTRVQPDRVTLTWYGAAMHDASATVYRQSAGSPWSALAQIPPDGTGMFRFEDRAVQPGERYGYRLGVRQAGAEEFYAETWVTVPAHWRLALAPPAPNPAASRLAIAFTLPSAGPALLEVLDIGGRRVAKREVGALGAGQHVLTFSEAAGWRPGIYLVRLAQGGQALTTRVSIVR